MLKNKFIMSCAGIFTAILLSASANATVGTWSAPYQPTPPGVQYPISLSPINIANNLGYYYTAPLTGACNVGEIHKYFSYKPTIPGRGWISFYHQTCN